MNFEDLQIGQVFRLRDDLTRYEKTTSRLAAVAGPQGPCGPHVPMSGALEVTPCEPAPQEVALEQQQLLLSVLDDAIARRQWADGENTNRTHRDACAARYDREQLRAIRQRIAAGG